MGHRHLHSKSPMFESEPSENWNHMHADQNYVHLGRSSTSENGSFIYPVENMSIDGISFPSHWNSTIRSNGYASSSLNIEVPLHQSDASGTSNNHFMHLSSVGAFFQASENYPHQPSSDYDGEAFHVNSGFIDLTMGGGRGPHRRKSLGIPPLRERGSTSRYFNGGGSTDLPISSELLPEKPNIDSQYMPCEHVTMTPTVRGEGSLRNVRSRSALNLESNHVRTHLLSNHSHSYSAVLPADHSSMVDLSGQSSSTSTRDWRQMSISPADGMMLLPDTSAFSLETGNFLVGSGATASNTSIDVGAFHQELTTSGNLSAPQSFHNNLTQTARGVRSNYSQRSPPVFRAPSGLCLGHVTPSDDGLPMVAENYSSRHPRPSTTNGWRNSDRNVRSRISSDRYRSLVDEGFMIMERASQYGSSSRNMVDQQRDMRMDIDNMSYEELLALGERIGHVSTGLSEDLFPKCLIESIYCSSEQNQDEGTCVVCLEDYKNLDDVGTLKTCGHDYHVSCIKKWLSMKKLCPICKASALPEDTKDK